MGECQELQNAKKQTRWQGHKPDGCHSESRVPSERHHAGQKLILNQLEEFDLTFGPIAEMREGKVQVELRLQSLEEEVQKQKQEEQRPLKRRQRA
jgi:hypothetical protein